jgi:hypothetical protein
MGTSTLLSPFGEAEHDEHAYLVAFFLEGVRNEVHVSVNDGSHILSL